MQAAIPDLPNQDQWPLAERIIPIARSLDYAPVAGQVHDPTTDGIRFRASVQVRNSLATMMKTRCQICHGFGHSKKQCVVDRVIRHALGFSRIATSKYSSAKTRMVVEGAAHLKPGAPVPRPPVPVDAPMVSSSACRLF